MLRDEAPVYRNDELGFWALSRHADVLAVHNDWGTYSSTGGVTIGLREPGRVRPEPPRRAVDPVLRLRHPPLPGRPPGRLEVKIAFEEILKRFPDFVADPERAVMKVSANVRGAANLPFATKGAALAPA